MNSTLSRSRFQYSTVPRPALCPSPSGTPDLNPLRSRLACTAFDHTCGSSRNVRNLPKVSGESPISVPSFTFDMVAGRSRPSVRRSRYSVQPFVTHHPARRVGGLADRVVTNEDHLTGEDSLGRNPWNTTTTRDPEPPLFGVDD